MVLVTLTTGDTSVQVYMRAEIWLAKMAKMAKLTTEHGGFRFSLRPVPQHASWQQLTATLSSAYPPNASHSDTIIIRIRANGVVAVVGADAAVLLAAIETVHIAAATDDT